MERRKEYVIKHIFAIGYTFATRLEIRKANRTSRKMLAQVFYILFFYFVGEFVSFLIRGFIPGSVIGMLLLFVSLAFRWVKPEKVDKLSKLLTDNMGLFFLPAGVGLMTSFGVISQYWPFLLIASVISTVLVIASVALLQQKMGKELPHE